MDTEKMMCSTGLSDDVDTKVNKYLLVLTAQIACLHFFMCKQFFLNLYPKTLFGFAVVTERHRLLLLI